MPSTRSEKFSPGSDIKLLSLLFIFVLLLPIESFAYSPLSPNVDITQQGKSDITDDLAYFQLPVGELPIRKEGLPDFLAKLVPHGSTKTWGDRFIAVAQLTNLNQIQDWFIYPSGAIVENITIQLYRANGQIDKMTTGHNHKNLIDYHYGARFQIAPGETVTLVMLFDSDIFSSPIKISVEPYYQAHANLKVENIVLLISVGVCIALALYNLFLYYGTRQKQYLYYSLATFGFTLGWSQAFGVFNFLLDVTKPEWIIVPFFFGFIFIALFTSNFLQLKQSSPKLHATLKVMAGLSFVCLPVSFISLGSSLILASLFSSIILLVSLYSGIKSWRSGYSPAKYFVFALLTVLMPNIVGNFLNLGLLPGIQVNVYLLSQLGNSLDSLLLAFALAEKVRLLNLQNADLTDQLEQRVTIRTIELSKANDKLETLITDLKQADSAKNVFLANMSHEIRTPLTSIIGYADGILNGVIDQNEQQEVIKIISQNGNHLLTIISDILDLTKVEAQKLEFEYLPTSLLETGDQVDALLKVRAREKGLDFHIDYQLPLPASVHTDPTRLKQVLFNLISNALKFTEQGYVVLSVSAANNLLKFEIKDTGIGMTEQQLSSLFDPFEQGDKAITRKYGGTGLGLSISKYLIEAMGGKIRVESKFGIGSTFTFTLPLNEENLSWINQKEEESSSVSNTALSLPDFNNVKVLLVDDHDHNRDLISRLMSKMNISVVQAQSGIQALECLDNYKDFALILLDIQMPNMDGLETLRRIRSKGIDVPVIALTANSMEHEVKSYLEQGFSSHLSKPLVRNHFIKSLKYFLTAKACSKGVLSNQDMLDMTRTYLPDLTQRVTQFKKHYTQGNQEDMLELAHTIKGSAGSFGFQVYSKLFGNIETALKEQDKSAFETYVKELNELASWSLDTSKIDIPQGIINHENNLGLYNQQLKEFFPIAIEIISAITLCVGQKDNITAQLHTLKLLPELKKHALTELTARCYKLNESLNTLPVDTEQSNKQLEELEAGLSALKSKVLVE